MSSFSSQSVRCSAGMSGFLALSGLLLCTFVAAQAADEQPELAVGQFITVTSPVNDSMTARVMNTALELQTRAAQEDKSAVLVLEITNGSSRFGHISDLARFLTSTRVANVRTVAWVPESVSGYNVILALACSEIVMHPDAELGDIGRGRPVDDLEQQFVVNLMRRRHNRFVSPALAHSMLDSTVVLMQAQVETGKDSMVESRVLTEEELHRLRDTGVAIRDAKTIKEAGVVGVFSGRQAARGNFLVARTSETRRDVAQIYGLPLEAMRENATTGSALTVRVIRVDKMIEPVLEGFVQRQIQRSLAAGVNLIIFEIDSPGGFLLSGENLAFTIAELDPKQVRTVAYIPREALSSAAIVALGCDEIYLHSDAQLGDAGPIEMRQGGQFERAPEKILSTLRLHMKSLAEKKGRPPALLMAMADRNLHVYKATNRETGRVTWMSDEELQADPDAWERGPVVPESEQDLLLTFDGRRAHEVGLAQAPVNGIEELRDRLGIAPEVKLVPAGRTWIDTLVFVLNSGPALFLLVTCGIVCIYIELHVPSGFFGILSVVCFGVFFWSRFLGGTAGWLEVILFTIGLACLALEIFVVPGFGVFGVSGIILVLASLVMASQTFGNLEPNADFRALSQTMGTLGASVLAVITAAMFLNRFLPSIPILNQMILAPPGAGVMNDSAAPRLRPEYTFANSSTRLIESDPKLVGERGVAVSMLRPSGKARIGKSWLDVISNGPFIPQGAELEVTSVSGNRVVVRQIEETSNSLTMHGTE